MRQLETQPETGNVTVWLSEVIMASCILEADAKFPLETGGTFMGWWAATDTAVVTAVIGPGPGAYHERYEFQPDQQWQLEQIALHYKRSGRRETYLGDWHSHPRASSGSLSGTDRGVLRRVIGTPEARCSSPLMMVLWGSPNTWSSAVWRAKTIPRLLLWPKLLLSPVIMRSF